ncbi:MAG: flagellar biosynthetic protein FliO [Planctomycetota bacterium]
MIRHFYYSVLILVCSLCGISNVNSEDVNPAARTSGFHQPRAASGATPDFSQQTQRNVTQRTQARGENTQHVSNQYNQRTIPSRAINQSPQTAIEAKSTSRPITPVDRQKLSSQSPSGNGVSRQAPSMWGTLSALVVVISIILVTAKLFKKHHPLASTILPREVMEVLGKRPLDARQTIHFVRCGSRILILGSSPAGLEMLSEVLDPVEVDLITGMCRERAQSGRSTTTFKNLFQATQKKSDQSDRSQAADVFGQAGNTEQSPRTTAQGEFEDYDSAVTRLQQKLLHSSRQSLNDNAESGHA